MDAILNLIYYIVPFVVLLGILVFVHEFGHFIVARLLGVTVTDFSIGFGKELWSRRDKHGTKWKVSAIPLGGYCQFLGDADASSSTTADLSELSDEAKKGAFPLQKAWKKLAIVAAGPGFNYLFAIFIFIALFYSFGRIVYPSVIGGLMEGEAAEQAGLLVGDKIVALNGNKVENFKQLTDEITLSVSDDVVVAVERPYEVTLTTQEITYTPKCGGEERTEKLLGLRSVDIEVDEKGNDLPTIPEVGEVMENTPAAAAGIQSGDILESVDGIALESFTQLREYVQAHDGKEFLLKLRRPMRFDVRLKDTTYTDHDGEKIKRRMLGVMSTQDIDFAETDMSFAAAVKAGFVEAYDLTANTLRAVGQMITGQRGGKEVGGIIRIAEMSGDVSKKGGLINFIYFMALLSVNLGLINLLPIPVLDGGNFVIFFIEMITRRELNAKIKDYIFKFGLLIIVAIMILATWNDVVHLIGRWFD